MLGTVQPDLIATQVQAPSGTIAPGASGSVTVTVMNQGDGPMPDSKGWLCISNSNVIHLPGAEPVYGTFSVPALAPNQTTSIKVPFTIPAGHATGQFFLGVALDAGKSAAESSEVNNLNPFLAGDHGNAPITIK
jgi:subtilase family serine protease